MIRHLLLIKFKSEVEQTEIQTLQAMFQAMPGKIDGVLSVEWGENDSPENLNQGYTHSVVMNFADDASRQHYLPHPEHEILKALFVPMLEDIIVFDYQV